MKLNDFMFSFLTSIEMGTNWILKKILKEGKIDEHYSVYRLVVSS